MTKGWATDNKYRWYHLWSSSKSALRLQDIFAVFEIFVFNGFVKVTFVFEIICDPDFIIKPFEIFTFNIFFIVFDIFVFKIGKNSLIYNERSHCYQMNIYKQIMPNLAFFLNTLS